MAKKKLPLLDADGNEIVVVKKNSSKIARNVIYYVCGAVMSVFFLFPLIYMLAYSTKTDAAIGESGSR